TPEGKWQPLNIIIQSVRLVLDESYSTKQNFATKPNGLVPAEYLTHCFERLTVDPDNLEALMPWNIKGLKSAK
ncbi:transposase domain-containing protein, partial [Vibrio mediterranei]|uniref:transposase domain-containing protein n=1 Tax=Vibrio mediterranei TaxID=689 RepID=UPI00148CC078